MQTFFQVNMGLIYFVYSLIFFLMGFAILLKNRIYSQFTLAKSIKYLAYFGIVHGIADLGLFFIPIQSGYLSSKSIDFLESLQVFFNGLSFYFLLIFGLHLLVLTKNWSKKLLLLPFFVFFFWVCSIMFLQPIMFYQGNQDWWVAISDITARYLMALPGGILASWGLLAQIKQLKDYEMHSMVNTLVYAALSMGIYSIVGGLVVQYSPTIPVIFFHSEQFFEIVGLPIEVLRSLAGLLMSFFIIRILKVFDLEYQVFLYHAEKTQVLNEERNRIARDLHDGMIQSIYAVGLQLEGTKYYLTLDKPKVDKVEEEIDHVNQRLNEIIKEVRGYIKDLILPLKSNVVIADEIQHLIEELKISNHCTLKFFNFFKGESPSLSKTIQVYYIVKEALVNILKHAEASKVNITIAGNKDDFRVIITDDGKGFDNNFISLKETGLYYHGIKNMKYRAKMLQGKLEISSKEEKGTVIKLIVNSRGGKDG